MLDKRHPLVTELADDFQKWEYWSGVVVSISLYKRQKSNITGKYTLFSYASNRPCKPRRDWLRRVKEPWCNNFWRVLEMYFGDCADLPEIGTAADCISALFDTENY